MIKQTSIYYERLHENPHPNTQISTPIIQYKHMKSDKSPLFSWPIPVNMCVPPGGNEILTPWSQLKFNPLWLYHLHKWQGVFLGECGFFVTKQSQFEAADVTWFAAGMHEDGAHDHPHNHFHLLHNDVHQEVSNAYMDPKGVKVQKSDQTRDWTQDLLDIYQML